MAPKKSSTAAGRGAPDSHRGAKQDSQRGAKKKAGGGAAKKKSSLEAVSEGSVTTAQEEALLPLADLLAPAQAILDELAKELEEAIKEQGDVTEIIVPVVVEQTSAAEETKANDGRRGSTRLANDAILRRPSRSSARRRPGTARPQRKMGRLAPYSNTAQSQRPR